MFRSVFIRGSCRQVERLSKAGPVEEAFYIATANRLMARCRDRFFSANNAGICWCRPSFKAEERAMSWKIAQFEWVERRRCSFCSFFFQRPGCDG